jgi:lipoprotein-anchoring transpeptidase ErfK/SrfK
MQDGNWATRRPRRAMIGVLGVTISALMLAGCTSNSTTASGSSGGGSGGGAATSSAAPANPVTIAITPTSSGTPINPTTPIVVKATNGTLDKVTVTNTVKGTVVTGDLSSDKTTWTSNEALGYGATYAVDATGAGSDGKSTEQKSQVSVLDPKEQSNANMIPAPGAYSSLGVGQPIVFQFSHAVTDKTTVQKALTVTSTPAQQGAWYWISSTQVDYRPETYWQAGTTLHVTAKVYGLDLGGGNYGAADRDVTYKIHDAWIAKADGNTDTMQIFDNGSMVKSMPISMGKGATPTHDGTHVISSKSQSVQMNSCTYGVCPPDPRAYNETEYWAERISNDGEFVHENPDTVSQQGSANVSHGCINLSEANAEWFFNHLGPGDVVEVTNSGGPKLPLWDLYGDWEVPWSTWSAGNA